MSRPSVAAGAVAIAVLLVVLLLLPAAPTHEPVAAKPGPSPTPAAMPLTASPPGPAPRVANPQLVAGGQGQLLVVTADAGAVPNEGLQANFTAFPSSSFPPFSSFQVAAEEVIGNDEAVFGLFENNLMAPTAFFSVFSNATDQTLHLSFWNTLLLQVGASYDFVLTRTSGTVWQLTVNGVLFNDNPTNASFDFGARNASWIGGIGFSERTIYSDSPTVPALVQVPLAFAVESALGGWYVPTSGLAEFSGSNGSQWGIEGRAQHPTLAPDEIASGRSLANVTSGTPLWTTGPVPVVVGITLPTSPAVATSPAEVVVDVRDPSGVPLPGVPVYLSDSLGGAFLPDGTATDPNGSAVVLWTPANVSASSPVTVEGTVTLLGYRGAANASGTVRPALHVQLSITPSAPSVAPNGRLTLGVRSTAENGTTVPGVLVGLRLTGLGNLTGTAVLTGSSGNGAVVYVAPAVATTSVLEVVVTNPGEWGVGAVTIHVGGGSRGLLPSAESLALDAVGLALLAVLVALVIRRLRRQPRPLPPLALRTPEPGRGAAREVTLGVPPPPPPGGGGPGEAPPPQP